MYAQMAVSRLIDLTDSAYPVQPKKLFSPAFAGKLIFWGRILSWLRELS